MIINDKTKSLFNLVINNTNLTKENLMANNLNEEDINDFLTKDLLKTNDRGYTFTDGISLYDYGNYCLGKKEFDKAFLAYQKAYELNPEDENIVYALFKLSVARQDEKLAVETITKLIAFCNYERVGLYYFYLYILSIITDINSRYDFILKALDLNDIVFKFPMPQETFDIISSLLYEKRLSKGQALIQEFIQKNENKPSELIVINNLLFWAFKKSHQNSEIISNLLKARKYEDALLFIKGKNFYYKEKYNSTRIIIKALLSYQTERKFPKVRYRQTNSFNLAVANNDFDLAYLLVNETHPAYYALVEIQVIKEYEKIINYAENGEISELKMALKRFLELKYYPELESLIWYMYVLKDYDNFFNLIANLKDDTLKIDEKFLNYLQDNNGILNDEMYRQIVDYLNEKIVYTK